MTKEKKQELSITVKKEENISEWYTQVIQKADLMDYTKVSGCIVFKPNSYQIWEKIQEYFDKKIKSIGVKNAYFPLLIPESLLCKEEEHVEGFTPEVAWVTHAGDTKLGERLAVRPTSETVMYDSYSKWIQSYRDLPLRLNQWCSVIRWEFKHPTPFMRNREFLWQEGHTAFATREEAVEEVYQILDFYADIYENLLAIPVNKGVKSIGEKFAGADFTTTVESLSPEGKSIQGGTSHHLGQNFAKAFDISFLDKNQKKQYVHQNSWGITTRTLAGMILIHSDNKGLVLPPRVATNKIVIVPLLFKGKEKKVLDIANKLKEELKEFNPILDDRIEVSAGFKFNEWEMKGIPIRIEIGPRDIENNEIILSRRDSGEKQNVNMNLKLFNFDKKYIKEGYPTVFRENVAVILKNSKGQYLCIEWNNSRKWKAFVGGGIENNDIITSAINEIKEETGYTDVKFIEEIKCHVHDKFYAPHKEVNRHLLNRAVVFEVTSDKQIKIDKKELEKHKPIWVDKDKVEDFLSVENHKFLWREYLKQKQKYDSVKYLITDILEDMHQNLYNNAQKMMDSLTVEVDNFKDFEKAINQKKRCLVPWAESIETEDEIKEKTGAKSSCKPIKFQDKSLKGKKCFYSGKPATCWAYFAKSY